MSRKLLKNTVKVGGLTMVSRILGFARDMVFARVFGAGLGMDAFFVAFKIPNFLRRLFGEGAFSQAFVPVLSEYKACREHEEVQALADRVAGTLLGVLLMLAVVGVLAAPVVVMIFAPGFLHDQHKFDLTAQMLRITFPYIVFISLVAFGAGILNSYGRFGVPAFSPVLLNLSLIGTALFLAPHMADPVKGLAWGVFLGGVAQLALILPALRGIRLLPRPRWGWHDSGVRRILKLMGPAVLGSSVAQINLLLDTLIASFLVTGSVSWLYYSDRLMEFPLGVFGIALSTVILPTLSRSHARASREAFSQTLDWALRWVVVVGVPAAVGLLLLAGPVLSTLFLSKAFDVEDVYMARLSLMAFAAGLPAFILVKVLAPGFYSRQDTRTPVRIAVVAMTSNMAMNVAFVVPMLLLHIQGPHAGLALATSLAAYLNAGLLYRALRRQDAFQPQPGWGRLLLRVGVSVGVLAAVLIWGAPPLSQWLTGRAWLRAGHLVTWIAIGIALYLVTLRLMGLRLSSLWTPPPALEGHE
jgi:putative peptidoglycan lipid II flippase